MAQKPEIVSTTAEPSLSDVRADLDPRLVTRLLFGMVNSVTEWYRPGGAHGRQEV